MKTVEVPKPQPVSSSDDTIQPPTVPPVLKGKPILSHEAHRRSELELIF